ncbi:E3 SUMO-protein ligase ZBED1-like [Drosophila mojavensis]|uniref:E3 SUMO-protein ligase ZBED1-like n=1 Tax=Drosophila mojavensis TaxID=7230 RepID=UPI001CD11288|nr:E3 SUMO-protein ligase ZBED1-like [Drosophila mojavensis]
MDKFLRDASGKDRKSTDIDEGETQVKRTRYGQSEVWKFFTKSCNGSAKCLKCGKVYLTSGNTSNLSGHLKRMHPTLTISELPKETGSILSFIDKKYEPSSNRKKALDSALMYYISSDMRPFSVVENKGFRHLVKALDPRYELPSRSKLRDSCMTDLYKKNEKISSLSLIAWNTAL